MGDDVVVIPEDAVGEPVLAHELPDVLDRVELRGTGREGQERDVRWDLEPGGYVPPCLIEDDDGMGARIDGGADLLEMRLHCGGIGEGHYQGCALAELRADRPENIGPFRALVVRRPGPRAAPGPAPRDQVLLADTRLVLEPDLDPLASGVALPDLRHRRGEVFLNASMACAS